MRLTGRTPVAIVCWIHDELIVLVGDGQLPNPGSELVGKVVTSDVGSTFWTWRDVQLESVSRSRDGVIGRRYSFTYVKNAENWLIFDHHSSAMPQAPK